MLEFLKKQWAAQKSFSELTKHPILWPTYLYVMDVYKDRSQGIGKHFSEKGKSDLLGEILSNMDALLKEQNPTQAVRMALIYQMHGTAAFDVLVSQPPTPFKGISGELKPRIPELAKKDEELERYFYNADDASPKSFDEMWDLVLARYWVLHLCMSALNVARIGLADRYEDRTKDWYRPCYTSMCIWQEHCYREALGLPSAIEGEDYDARALMHSTWINRAEEGHRELRLVWERSWEEIFHEPSPYTGLAM